VNKKSVVGLIFLLVFMSGCLGAIMSGCLATNVNSDNESWTDRQAFEFAELTMDHVLGVDLLEYFNAMDDQVFLVFAIPNDRLAETLNGSPFETISPVILSSQPAWRQDVDLPQLETKTWEAWKTRRGGRYWRVSDETRKTTRCLLVQPSGENEYICYFAYSEY